MWNTNTRPRPLGSLCCFQNSFFLFVLAARKKQSRHSSGSRLTTTEYKMVSTEVSLARVATEFSKSSQLSAFERVKLTKANPLEECCHTTFRWWTASICQSLGWHHFAEIMRMKLEQLSINFYHWQGKLRSSIASATIYWTDSRTSDEQSQL